MQNKVRVCVATAVSHGWVWVGGVNLNFKKELIVPSCQKIMIKELIVTSCKTLRKFLFINYCV